MIRIWLILLLLSVVWRGAVYAQEDPDTVTIEVEETVVDTLQVLDTVYSFDTVYVDHTGPYRSVAFLAGYDFPWVRFPDNMDETVRKQNVEALSGYAGFSAGGNIRFDWNAWSAETGLHYAYVKQDFIFSKPYFAMDTGYQYFYDSTLMYEVDTIDEYYQMVEGDTITVYVMDSSSYWNVDTTENISIDSIPEDSVYACKNYSRRLDIPLIFSVPVWINSNHCLSVQAGMVGSLVFSQEMMYVTEKRIVTKEKQMAFIPSVFLGLSYEQYIGENLGLEVSGNYRRTVFSKLPAFDRIGFHVKLRYYF
ncbi:MAG: hypothetical protein PF590_10910 [Candidatus Delongbacteria bacterium]|nr:hypothetical protein [Candidatus Delongbacteria bacterium]